MEFAKENPEGLTYGSSGMGTPGHLAMEHLKNIVDVEILHIPYKGNTPLMNEILGGHVDIAMLTTPGAAEQVRADGMQAIAVSSIDRSPLMPDVPTVIESGFEGYSATLWNLLVTPKNTPAANFQRIKRCHARCQRLRGIREQGLSSYLNDICKGRNFPRE